mmetsp:Transcript_68431/g.164304  ORF Transcript_68431/g.164304 Transcript_68431/m.164304 type:complete len:99 (-) Transcript_68431:1473-1769(-)
MPAIDRPVIFKGRTVSLPCGREGFADLIMMGDGRHRTCIVIVGDCFCKTVLQQPPRTESDPGSTGTVTSKSLCWRQRMGTGRLATAITPRERNSENSR